MIWHMYCCLLTFYCFCLQVRRFGNAGHFTAVKMQLVAKSLRRRRHCYHQRHGAHARRVSNVDPGSGRSVSPCMGDMFRSDKFLHFMINPRLCRFNISDNLCLICSQPANKLINNSLPSGRALKPNIQRASFWKCAFLKTCEAWTSMWAERQTGPMMSFTDGSWSGFHKGWHSSQDSDCPVGPVTGTQGCFLQPSMQKQFIRMQPLDETSWCRLLDLSLCQTVTSSFTSVVFRVAEEDLRNQHVKWNKAASTTVQQQSDID